MPLPQEQYYTVEDYDTVIEPDITVVCEPDKITKRGSFFGGAYAVLF